MTGLHLLFLTVSPHFCPYPNSLSETCLVTKAKYLIVTDIVNRNAPRTEACLICSHMFHMVLYVSYVLIYLPCLCSHMPSHALTCLTCLHVYVLTCPHMFSHVSHVFTSHMFSHVSHVYVSHVYFLTWPHMSDMSHVFTCSHRHLCIYLHQICGSFQSPSFSPHHMLTEHFSRGPWKIAIHL